MTRIGIAAAAALLLAIGTAEAEMSDPEAVSGVRPPTGERATPYWTPELQAAAEMEPLPEVDPGAVRAAIRERASAAGPFASQDAIDDDVPSEANERVSGSVGARPLFWAGKVFYRKPTGNSWCSAQFITRHVVLTAAHCVRDHETGTFYRNFAFALQYEQGRSSKVYDYDCVATLNGWVQTDLDRYRYDYAMLRVDERSRTGAFGYIWNWLGRYDRLTKIGYPASMAGGKVIQIERGPATVENGLVELRHGNRADQGGSSGGAWIGNYSTKSGSYNHIASVQSFTYPKNPGTSYGPYFTESFLKLRDYVENGCR